MNSDLLASSFYDPGNFFPITWPTKTLLRSMYQQVERIERPAQSLAGIAWTTLFSDSDFEMVMRMFNQDHARSSMERFCFDESNVRSESEKEADSEAPAYLIRFQESTEQCVIVFTHIRIRLDTPRKTCDFRFKPDQKREPQKSASFSDSERTLDSSNRTVPYSTVRGPWLNIRITILKVGV